MAQIPPQTLSTSISATTTKNIETTLTIPTDPSSLLDLYISLHLSLWPALSIAISLYTPPAPSSSNPSPASTGKEVRDWLAGAISSMMQSGEVRDQDDLEEVLVQVVGDEFEVMVEDGSEAVIAGRICKGAERISQGGVENRRKVEDELRGLWRVWVEKGGDKAIADAAKMGKRVEVSEDAQDTDEEVDEDGDEEMGDVAPELVELRERPRRDRILPEVDEEGFTKVVGKKKR